LGKGGFCRAQHEETRNMRYRRDYKGSHYFFTVVTEQRQKLLTLPGNIARLREAFRREIIAHPFYLDAVVILPDHLHCLWWLPEENTDYSGRWARIKRYFSIGCVGSSLDLSDSRKKKRELPIWQRRFWEHRIRNEEDWRRHMNYIHYNPIKHGYVTDAWEWPYSSLRRCADRGLYPENWCMTESDMNDYKIDEK
jgi:putative transposase